jgi:hypothetical protein
MVNVKTTLVQFQNSAFAGNASTWKWPLATTYGGFAIAVGETQLQRPAGTYSNLRVRVVTNTNNNTSTVRFDKGGSNSNLVVSIAATNTGSFEDVANSDTVTAGQNNYMTLSVVNGSTGSITLGLTQIDFLASADTHASLAAHGSAALSTASTTNYNPLTSTLANNITTESQTQTQFRNSFTLKNFRIRVTADARSSNTTYRIRKNAANGSQSIATTNTGEFEDTTNTDTVASNDKINFSFTTGTGSGSHTIGCITVDVENTTNSSFPFPCTGVGASQNFGLTRYETASLTQGLTTEANAQVKLYTAATLKNLTFNSNSNTVNNTSTVQMRVNGANANPVVSVGASTSGFFTDNSTTATTASGDLVNFVIVTGGTSGALAYRTIYVEVAPNYKISTTKTHKYNITGKITQTKTHKYNIVAKVSTTKTHKYNIVAQVSKTKTHKYNITGKITQTKTHKYNIIAKVSTTKTHKYNIIQKITKTKTHKYHVDTNTIKVVKRDLEDTVDSYGFLLTKQTGTDTSVEKEVPAGFAYLSFITPRDHIFKKDWENGNWIFRLRITVPHSDVTLDSVYLTRISNDTSFNRAIKSVEYLNIPLSAAGVYGVNIPWNDGSQNADVDRAENDRIMVEVALLNLSGISRTIEYGTNLSSFNDEITTPIPVPTQVSTTKTHKFNVTGEGLTQVSTTKTHKYNILEKITKNKVHVYNIIGKITQTKTHKYNVIGKITQQKTHKYNILERISSQKTHKYNILQKISTTKTHKFNIIGKITQTRTHKYNIIGKITQTKTHKFNIIGKITATKTHKYNIQHKITATKTHKYNILQKISTTKTHRFNVLHSVATTKTHKYNIIGKITATKTHKYHVEGKISVTKTHRFNILQQISTIKTHKYDILNKITTTKTHKYDISSPLWYVSTTKTHKFNVQSWLVPVSTEKTHKYNILQRVTTENTHIYNVIGRFLTYKTHKFNIIGKITVTKSHLFNIIGKVTVNKQHRFVILNKVTLTKSHKYNILGKVTRNRTHKYNIIGHITISKTHRYNMGGKLVVNKTHKYHITGKLVELQEIGGSTHALIKLPERIRIVDIISDIRNRAVANIEISPHLRENIAVANVAIEKYTHLLTAETQGHKHKIQLTSGLILPPIIDTIQNNAHCLIGKEIIEPQQESLNHIVGHLSLQIPKNQHPIVLIGHTQLAENWYTIIRVASNTEVAGSKHKHRSQSHVLLPYNVSRNRAKTSGDKLVDPEYIKRVKTLIKIIKSDALFGRG